MNNKFCILPFIHFNGYMDGTAKACCDSQTPFSDIDLKDKTIEEAFNSEEYKKLRIDMLNGVQNSYCDSCYNLEDNNIKSSRQKWNEHHKDKITPIIEKYSKDKFDGTVDTEFVSLDLRPSNICNFKCRTCNDSFSTRWQEEKEDFYKTNMGKLAFGTEKLYGLNKIDFQLNEDSMVNIEVLYFAGGEPFVLEEHFNLIESLKNKDKISLMYNTNFSILKYKGKSIYEYLKEFRKVHFCISLDGLGELGEYIRTGFDTKVFNKNLTALKLAKGLYNNIEYDFQYTCSLLNAFDFFDFMEELGESQHLINFHHVHYPFWYNPINFPEIKQQLIEFYEANLNKIYSDKLLESVQKYILYLKNSKPSRWDEINALKYLKGNVFHTIIFNDIEVPEKLNFIKKLIFKDANFTEL